MSFSMSDRIAFSQVIDIIDIMGKKYEEKVPKKLLELLKKEEAKDYETNIKRDLPFEKQNISRTALILLNYINKNYWIESEETKKRIKNIYWQNEQQYMEVLSPKYDIYEIFKKRRNR